jgi:hypothetical protein
MIDFDDWGSPGFTGLKGLLEKGKENIALH